MQCSVPYYLPDSETDIAFFFDLGVVVLGRSMTLEGGSFFFLVTFDLPKTFGTSPVVLY